MKPSTWSLRASLVVPTLGGVLLASAACASSGDASSAWSRSYLAPRDKVVDAAVHVLEEEQYLVELDRATGRIEARPSREKAGRRIDLVVRVDVRKDRVWVDVQTRSQTGGDLKARQLDQGPVLEFFHQLDLRMQGIRD